MMFVSATPMEEVYNILINGGVMWLNMSNMGITGALMVTGWQIEDEEALTVLATYNGSQIMVAFLKAELLG